MCCFPLFSFPASLRQTAQVPKNEPEIQEKLPEEAQFAGIADKRPESWRILTPTLEDGP